MAQDAVLNNLNGYYDFSLDNEGQIVVEDFFDTALLYSIFGEKRADASEVPETSLRRGWIGNEDANYENGSKLWLQEQSRVTRSTLNNIQEAVADCLKWLVTDKFVQSIGSPVAEARGNSVSVTVTIYRTASRIVQRTFQLWDNTGIR